jgi:polar amino acid transport system substrate-binding protein
MGVWSNIRGLALVVAIVVSGCVAPFLGPAASAQEKLVFCSDIAYPPMESFQGSEPIGADIDLGREIAKRLGREAEFNNVGFDAIVAALLGNQCDAIISGMNNTPERAKTVDFVDYLLVGQSIVVPKGNPLGVTSLEDLCGHTAGAQVGTTNLDTLNQANEACAAAGKPAVEVTGFKADTDAMLALKANRLDVYETDSPVGAYYIGQEPDTFEFGGPPINTAAYGIAFRKEDTALRDQVQQVIDAMYADGTMMMILEKWQLQDFALPGSVGATPEVAAATPAAA